MARLRLATSIAAAFALAAGVAACGGGSAPQGAPAPPGEEAASDFREPGAPDPERPPLTGDDRPPIGFNSHAALDGGIEITTEAELQRTAGSSLWRVALDWRFAEPQPGELRLAAHDAIYCEALARGIAPLLHITGAPDWAADRSVNCPVPSCIDPPRADALEALRRFTAIVVRRYPAAAAIEVWNEPNFATFWTDPDPKRYTQVLAAIAAGVDDGGGEMPVLGGALSSTVRTAADGRRVAFDEFLAAMYEAGAAEHMDAVSFHPYPGHGEPIQRFTTAMSGLRRAIRDAGDEGRSIWVSEVGMPVVDEITEADQEKVLARIYEQLASAGDVEAVVFHTLLEEPEHAGSGIGFGWLEPTEGGFRPRPVYCAFAERFGEPMRCDRPLTP